MSTMIRPLKGYPYYFIKVEQEINYVYSQFHAMPYAREKGKRTVSLFNNTTGEEQLLYKFLAFEPFTPADIEEEAICLIENKPFTRYLALQMK